MDIFAVLTLLPFHFFDLFHFFENLFTFLLLFDYSLLCFLLRPVFFELVVMLFFLASSFLKYIIFFLFGISLFTLQRIVAPREHRGICTFPKNEALAVACLDTLDNGTFEWIPDPRVLGSAYLGKLVYITVTVTVFL